MPLLASETCFGFLVFFRLYIFPLLIVCVMLGGQNDHVRPADEGAFPNSSLNSRGTRVRGGNAAVENGSVQLAERR